KFLLQVFNYYLALKPGRNLIAAKRKTGTYTTSAAIAHNPTKTALSSDYQTGLWDGKECLQLDLILLW
ncbi:MAG: hypothetical protein AAFY26_19075, partial [Cyanobacteria bacterium J06638_22]